MWGADDGPYEGVHYQLAETLCSPPPVRQPHPPIMIGGGGERKTLRLVATYADACNLFAGPRVGFDVVRGKLDVLREHCARLGTDYDTIRKTITYAGTLDHTSAAAGAAFVEEMRAYADLGVTEVHLMPYVADPVEFVRGVGEHVLPTLAAV
jgi:alkanesulfonate monooxygenase SsuD/methylene tetrahydromethanopterin reductase-like flavin-dependent oxidoreductase (luciferase family)